MHESRGLNSSSNFLAMIIFIAIAISLPSDQAKGELKYALAGKKPMGSELVVPQCKPAVCSFQDDENGVFGAGVIVHPSGILITNCHVMANCGNYGFKLTSSQGAALEIDGVLDYNVQEDWAVLKVHLQGGQTAKMPFVKIGDSRKLQDGEACIAIGHPAGLERSVTSGLIQSASQKVPEFPIPLIYHSAPMYGGNSGGGLFSLKGGLVGINVAVYNIGIGYVETASPYCYAIPIHAIRLPQDTLKLIGSDCFCSFLQAWEDAHPSDAWDWPDWEAAREKIQGALEGCGEYLDAHLLLAECNFNLGEYRRCIQICQNIRLIDTSKNELAYYWEGQAWLEEGLSDSAETIYSTLHQLNSKYAPQLMEKITLKIITPARESDMAEETGEEIDWEAWYDSLLEAMAEYEQGESDSAESWDDSSLVASLSPLEKTVYDRYGTDGLRVYELIDGERTVEEIVQETGLTQDYLVEILLFFEEEGIIKLDWGEDSASQELYSGPPLDTAVVISALRSLCNHLVSVHGEWERIAAIIEELLRWETDYYYLEQDVLMLSVAYVMMSEPRRADSILSQALVHIYDPEDVLYSNRAWARLLIDNYQGAEEDFYRALEDLKETEKYYGLYPEDEHRRTSSKVGLALALLKQDRRSEAEAVFREVLAEEPRWQEGPVEYPEAFYSSEESHLMRLAYQEFVSKNSE